ncbi:MAG: helix-turn-helix domain-containing protein [Oscillospiraceae bacterium]
MKENERIGINIREMRRQCGYTQEKVANDLFISESYLRLIEHGKANPSINMVTKITDYLQSAIDTEEQEVII